MRFYKKKNYATTLIQMGRLRRPDNTYETVIPSLKESAGVLVSLCFTHHTSRPPLVATESHTVCVCAAQASAPTRTHQVASKKLYVATKPLANLSTHTRTHTSLSRRCHLTFLAVPGLPHECTHCATNGPRPFRTTDSNS